MQVTETLSQGLKRAYVVVVPGADIESRRAARLADLGKTLRLPGFRPGKVPLPIVRQRYGSAVNAEVLEESVEQATRQVLSERGLRPVTQPKVDVLNQDAEEQGGKDLEFKVEFELFPEIPPIDLAAIELTRLKAEVAAETVEKTLATLAERNRQFVEIAPEELAGRGAARGEFARVDYVGRIDGTEFPGGRGSDVDVEVGGAGFIPGFSKQIEGIRPGETRTIEVRFPDEYPAAEVAGKQASFEITAKVIKRAVAPEEGKDLAAILGFEGMDELRAVIRTQVQREYDQLSRLRLKRELLDTLDKRVAFATPEGMVETEFSQIWARLQADREAGRLDEEDRAKDEETLRADYRVIAERRVRLGLLLAEIGRAHDISVGADEMTRAMRMEASRYPGHEAQLMEAFRKNPRATDSLRGPILEEKVVDFILGQAKIEDRTVSPEELARDPEEAPPGPAGSAPVAGVAPAESPTDEPADQQLVDQPSGDQPSIDQPPADHPATEI